MIRVICGIEVTVFVTPFQVPRALPFEPRALPLEPRALPWANM